MKVLFVDDENERRNVFRGRHPDWEIFTCETSQNAISILEEHGPFHIIYLDHDLGNIEREPSEDMYEASPTFPITTRPLVRYLCRHFQRLMVKKLKGTSFVVHSWNTEAAEWIAAMLTEHGCEVSIERFNYKG